jgi:hypothetical protein
MQKIGSSGDPGAFVGDEVSTQQGKKVPGKYEPVSCFKNLGKLIQKCNYLLRDPV